MVRETKNFKNLLGGKLEGLTDAQLEAHFTLYEGYVKKINEIEEKLQKADRALTNYSFGEYSELKRRWCVPYNGVYLHEMYFENLINTGKPSQKLEELFQQNFGGFEAWKTDIKATGLAVPGWVVTCLEYTTGKLQNVQLAEHHIGFPINHIPLIVMDTWEHAFFLDYKANRGAYIDVFFKNLNWDVINNRVEKALR